jgi:hypothetical protein
VGPAWHNISNVVGPAYTEAYLLEQKSWEPRITYRRRRRAFGSHDGACRVNGLHDYYVPVSSSLFPGQHFSNRCPKFRVGEKIRYKIINQRIVRRVDASRMSPRIAIAGRALAMDC